MHDDVLRCCTFPITRTLLDRCGSLPSAPGPTVPPPAALSPPRRTAPSEPSLQSRPPSPDVFRHECCNHFFDNKTAAAFNGLAAEQGWLLERFAFTTAVMVA